MIPPVSYEESFMVLPNPTSPPNILLVEDNAAHAAVFQRLLHDCAPGTALDHVTNGRDAVEHLRRLADGGNGGGDAAPPQVVILDVRLPQLDGFGVLAEIRADRRLRHLPVVMLSTSAEPQDVDRSYELGANAYMAKPDDYHLMAQRVAALHAFWIDAACLPSQRHNGGHDDPQGDFFHRPYHDAGSD